jgi:hypothetical protein
MKDEVGKTCISLLPSVASNILRSEMSELADLYDFLCVKCIKWMPIEDSLYIGWSVGPYILGTQHNCDFHWNYTWPTFAEDCWENSTLFISVHYTTSH